jgi:hypothetical protein
MSIVGKSEEAARISNVSLAQALSWMGETFEMWVAALWPTCAMLASSIGNSFAEAWSVAALLRMRSAGKSSPAEKLQCEAFSLRGLPPETPARRGVLRVGMLALAPRFESRRVTRRPHRPTVDRGVLAVRCRSGGERLLHSCTDLRVRLVDEKGPRRLIRSSTFRASGAFSARRIFLAFRCDNRTTRQCGSGQSGE